MIEPTRHWGPPDRTLTRVERRYRPADVRGVWRRLGLDEFSNSRRMRVLLKIHHVDNPPLLDILERMTGEIVATAQSTLSGDLGALAGIIRSLHGVSEALAETTSRLHSVRNDRADRTIELSPLPKAPRRSEGPDSPDESPK